ncbi:MAG: DUF4038 domain-containing protein [Candidatus Hydrogenedentes bacterium]|nr:DUF4038 domain-containing protein [Candidatus Hydrogenedentota bacterium]
MKLYAQQNTVVEIAFDSAAPYDVPYNDIDLDVAFTGPGGTLHVPAFWAGGNRWCVRFAGAQAGEYEFHTVCSRPDDVGLHDRGGTLSVAPYSGDNALLKHGRLRVAADKRHFEHADGTPFFWIADTWWMGLCSRLDWPAGFRELAADRAAKGFNVVQIIAGPYPDMDAWDPRGRNEAGFPFDDGFERVNPAYFDHADLKLAHLVHAGLMPCIVGMWGYYLPVIGVARINRFWRYLVARYGAYPVAWCIAGEAAMPYYLSETKEQDAALQKQGWSEVMARVRDTDPFHNPITIHPTRYGREQVECPEPMDFEMLQTGHGDLESVPTTAESVLHAIECEPPMPVIVSEVNYEGILGRCWQNIQRLCFYHGVLNGAAGHTYGANGIWQVSARETPYGPSPHGRCWGNTPWRDAAQLPGSRQIGIGGAFIRRFPWWRFERHPEWVGAGPADLSPYALRAAGIPGELRIVYVPLLWDPPVIHHIEPDVAYEACYVDPCTGAEIPLGPVHTSPEGSWQPPLPPEVHDWLILMERV